MHRESSFVILYKEIGYSGMWIFSSITQRVYHFSYKWDIIIKSAVEHAELREKMIRLGIITHAIDYLEEIKEYFKIKNAENKKRIYVCFTITTKCNLRCHYCFQNHLNRRDTTLEVINRFGYLLNKKLEKDREIKEVAVILFGGEPLVRLDLCLYLLNMIRNICESKKVKHRVFMTTNGLQVNSTDLDLLKSAGLEGVQVTFDGSMKLHNEIRGKSCSNVNIYENTLKNLPKFAERFSVSIKYNLNKQNIDNFEEFITDINELSLPPVFHIKVEALHKTLTDKNASIYFDPRDPNLAKAYLRLALIAQESNIPFDISSAFQPPCMASSNNSFMVEPDGSISMCISAYNMAKFKIGNILRIHSLDFDRSFLNTSILNAAAKLCIEKQCPFFPICETGCLFTKALNGIDFEEPFCRESFYSAFVPGFIRLYIKSKGLEGD